LYTGEKNSVLNTRVATNPKASACLDIVMSYRSTIYRYLSQPFLRKMAEMSNIMQASANATIKTH